MESATGVYATYYKCVPDCEYMALSGVELAASDSFALAEIV